MIYDIVRAPGVDTHYKFYWSVYDADYNLLKRSGADTRKDAHKQAKNYIKTRQTEGTPT